MKAISIAAILAVAIAAIAVSAPLGDAEPDGDGPYDCSIKNTMYPVVFGQGANGVRAILYDDAVLMLDFGNADADTLQAKSGLYEVTVTSAQNGKVLLEHQAATQGKLYIDLSKGDGKNPMCMLGDMKVVVKSDDQTDSQFSDSITLTIPSPALSTPMKFVIYDGSTTKAGLFKTQSEVNTLTQDYGGTATAITGTTKVCERGKKMPLDTSTETMVPYADSKVTNLVDPDGIFELIGWTVKGTDTELALDLKSHTIEEIIYAYADAMWDDADWTAKDDKSKCTSTLTFYGCYGEKTYKIRLYDADSEETFKYILTTPSATATPQTDDSQALSGVGSYVNQEVDANGYAILRIQQDAGKHASYVYTFKHQPSKITENQNVKTEEADGEPVALKLGENEGYCTIQYLASGVYKISSVKKDLNIQITATENTVAPLSYNLSVDYVRNHDDAGSARVSLDLYDANISEDDTLKIDGTYFRNVGNIRTYGQLSTINSSIKVVYAYVDQQMDYYTVGGTDAATAPANFAKGKMALGTENHTGSSYDLVINLPTINEKNVFFYAAQAVWSDGDAVVAETPWAIAENADGDAPTVKASGSQEDQGGEGGDSKE